MVELQDSSEGQVAHTRDPNHRGMLLGLMITFFLLWVVLPLVVPGARNLVYSVTTPFRYLGVFVHEMGHGLFTLLSGGHFFFFKMNFNGGIAVTAGGMRGATLLGGLLGPGLLGAWLLMSSTRRSRMTVVFWVLILFFMSGIYYMIKPLFIGDRAIIGDWSIVYLLALVVPIGGIGAIILAMRVREQFQRIFVQILGITMCYSAFSDTRYIMHFEPLGNGLYSDSRVFAGLLWPGGPDTLPWVVFLVVAIGISLANIALMAWGTWRALKKP